MTVMERLEGRGKTKAWIKANLDFPHKDQCLIWPFASTGGSTIQIGANNTNVFRLMCEYRNGPPPTEKHQAAHSCGRRHEGCVNPHHLSWKTNGENQKERFQHSGRQPRFKLTPAKAAEIRSLEGRASVYEMANQFGVSPNTVRLVLAGKSWSSHRFNYRDWRPEEIQRIRAAPSYVAGLVKGLAEEFGVSIATIQRIKSGNSYTHVQEDANA